METGLFGVAAMLCTCIREVYGSNFGRDAGHPDLYFSGFPQTLQANAVIVPRLGLPCPLQVVTYLTFYHKVKVNGKVLPMLN
jgi:hypothetical protein